MQTLVEFQQVSYYYGQHCALNQLDLCLCSGEILALLGPNGAGKSTALSLLTGNRIPTSGQILVQGKDLTKRALQAKSAIGYLPQRSPLYPELRVDEYLHYCARLHQIPSKNIATAVAQAKEQCGLTQIGQQLIGVLSKGYQQRVGLAQAIIHRPPLLVFDEPTVGLDPQQVNAIRQLIQELRQEHGILLSTHLLPEVQTVCTDVAILHQGRLVFRSKLAKMTAKISTAVQIQLAESPPVTQLLALPKVQQVESLANGRFRLELSSADQAQLATHLVRWGLLVFEPEYPTLEQIFLRLTSGED